jgi:hypothetical protein
MIHEMCHAFSGSNWLILYWPADFSSILGVEN